MATVLDTLVQGQIAGTLGHVHLVTIVAGRCHAERDEIAVGAVKYGTVAPLGDRAGGNPFGALRNQ